MMKRTTRWLLLSLLLNGLLGFLLHRAVRKEKEWVQIADDSLTALSGCIAQSQIAPDPEPPPDARPLDAAPDPTALDFIAWRKR